MIGWIADRWRSAPRPVIAGLLAAGGLLLYAQVAGHQFLHFDDDQYVTDNPWVRAGLSWSGLRWAFTALAVANWHPLTWLSHMLDVQLFGMEAGAHHAVNAALHAANTALLFLALARMTGARGRSAFVAALFAAHPLHVESVAWVAERKDVLSSFFGFLMLWAYARHAERPGVGRYLVVAGCLALSLLAKPMWVTAPFLLLLLDGWPLQRVESWGVDPELPSRPRLPLRALLLEKLPLLVLSAGSAAMTLLAQQRGGAINSLERVGLGPRLANAVTSGAGYLGKTFWPVSLSAYYPLPPGGPAPGLVAGAAALLVGISAMAVLGRRAMPWLAVGWLWFLGTLVPVIGIVQVGSQGMADRYTYLPLTGVFVAVTWSVGRLVRDGGRLERTSVAAAGVTVLLALSAVTARQIGLWHDQARLFRHAVEVTQDNPRAHHILSQALAEDGRLGEALVHAREAARLDPENARTHKNLGVVLYRLGLLDDAIEELRRAVALQPDYAEAHGNLAIAYGRKGWFEAAAAEMALERQLRAAPSR